MSTVFGNHPPLPLALAALPAITIETGTEWALTTAVVVTVGVILKQFMVSSAVRHKTKVDENLGHRQLDQDEIQDLRARMHELSTTHAAELREIRRAHAAELAAEREVFHGRAAQRAQALRSAGQVLEKRGVLAAVLPEAIPTPTGPLENNPLDGDNPDGSGGD